MRYKLKNGAYYDNNGNSASVEYFGGDEEAIKALDSLVDCYNCYNCSNCLHCYNCYNCIDCSYSHYCSNRTDCSDYCDDEPCPVKPRKIRNLHQKVLSSALKEGALAMDDWACGTVMCHGGWIVYHGGKTGQKLLEQTGYCFAATQIAKVSGIPVSPAMFFVNDDDGMKNIKMLAEIEQSA